MKRIKCVQPIHQPECCAVSITTTPAKFWLATREDPRGKAHQRREDPTLHHFHTTEVQSPPEPEWTTPRWFLTPLPAESTSATRGCHCPHQFPKGCGP